MIFLVRKTLNHSFLAMSIQRSANCSAYTDTISVLVTGEAEVPGNEKCRLSMPATFSCQTKAFEAPDDMTKKAMEDAAMEKLSALGCDTSTAVTNFNTNIVGTQSMEYSAEKLSNLGMASNCFREGNDPNHITHRADATCNAMYDMTDSEGRRVRDVFRSFTSSLGTCDVSDEGMPQLMEDLRKVAAHNGEVNGLKVDRPEDLRCTFSVLPIL